MAFVRPITRLQCGPASVSGTSGLTANGTGACAASAATVSASGFVGQYGSGVLAAQSAAVVGAGGRPPLIASIPTPVFVFGTPSAYPMAQHVDDDYLPGVTYSMSPALTSGYVLDPVSGVLSYDGVGQVYPNDVYSLTVTDFTGQDTSALFNLVGGVTIEQINNIQLDLVSNTTHDMAQYINDPLGDVTSSQIIGLNTAVASYDDTPGAETLTAVDVGNMTGLQLEVTY